MELPPRQAPHVDRQIARRLWLPCRLRGLSTRGRDYSGAGRLRGPSGHLSLPLTLFIAFIAGTLGDQIFFWIGRSRGRWLLGRFPGMDWRADRVRTLLRRWDAPLIMGIRFMYGLRIVGPIVIGSCGVPPWRFAVLDVIGAAIWAPLVGGLGYLFGHAVEVLVGDIEQFEEAVLLLIIVAGMVFTVVRGYLKSRAEKRAMRPEPDS